MCNTCGCSAAEDFEAERRYRYGNRYITRDSKGRFKKNVDVGRSLSADRRRKAKTVKGVGQGGTGDYNAESNFDKLSNEIAEQYEKKGKSKEEAERIGKATAYKVGVAKYGKRGMERKAREGRAKSAETFEANSDSARLNELYRFENEVYKLDSDLYTRAMDIAEEGMGGRDDDSARLNILLRFENEVYKMDSDILNQAYRAVDDRMEAETFEAYDDNISDRQEWLIGELGGKVDKSMNRSQASDYIKELQGKESGTWKDAEEFGAEASCGNCGNALVMNAEGEHSCGCGTEMGTEMGAEGERKERKSFAPKMHMITYEEILEEKKKNQNMKDAEGMVYVKRPHHVALVRKEVAERPMDRGFEKPNMHTRANEKGNIWDDRTGFRKMDSKERGLFEEIGGKISDFDVVGTTQDVVSKTGFNIPTGVASIAVVFMAYMTGKKYGN